MDNQGFWSVPWHLCHTENLRIPFQCSLLTARKVVTKSCLTFQSPVKIVIVFFVVSLSIFLGDLWIFQTIAWINFFKVYWFLFLFCNCSCGSPSDLQCAKICVFCDLGFIGSSLSFRAESLWCTQKWAKVWYPYILRASGVQCRNISIITEGSTWALPCVFNFSSTWALPCVSNFSSTWALPCVSNWVCWIHIIHIDVIQRAQPLCGQPLVGFRTKGPSGFSEY